MTRVLVLWMVATCAMAQDLTPSIADFQDAAAAIRFSRATDALLERERQQRIANRIENRAARKIAALEAQDLAERRALDQWAAIIQAWSGQRRQSIVPGTGWHEVHR